MTKTNSRFEESACNFCVPVGEVNPIKLAEKLRAEYGLGKFKVHVGRTRPMGKAAR